NPGGGAAYSGRLVAYHGKVPQNWSRVIAAIPPAGVWRRTRSADLADGSLRVLALLAVVGRRRFRVALRLAPGAPVPLDPGSAAASCQPALETHLPHALPGGVSRQPTHFAGVAPVGWMMWRPTTTSPSRAS